MTQTEESFQNNSSSKDFEDLLSINQKRHYLYCYQMDPAPEKKSPEEYISLFQHTGDSYYFGCLLHYAEPRINRKAEKYCSKVQLRQWFEEIKQEIILALYESSFQYDPAISDSFFTFANYRIRDAVRELLRQIAGPFSVKNISHFRDLCMVNAMYYRILDEGKTCIQAVDGICQKLDRSPKAIYSLLSEGIVLRDYAVLSEEDDTEASPFRNLIINPADNSMDPGKIVPEALFMDEIIDAVESLPFKKQQILYGSCGILCIYCGRVGKRMAYSELAARFEMSSESSIEKSRKDAIRKIRKLIHADIQY